VVNIREQLRQLIAEVAEIDEVASIRDDADLFAEIGLDSMQAMELVLEMEQRFSIKITEEQLRTIRTLNDAVKLAQQQDQADA